MLTIEKSTRLSINAHLGEKDSNWAAKLSLSLRADHPSKIVKLEFTGVPVPPAFMPKRMTQAAALAAMSGHADELEKRDLLSGAVLIARHNKILFQKAWGFPIEKPKRPIRSRLNFASDR